MPHIDLFRKRTWHSEPSSPSSSIMKSIFHISRLVHIRKLSPHYAEQRIVRYPIMPSILAATDPRVPPICLFLELPAEIRNCIYGYCSPINGHIQDYYGLNASCTQIHSEYEAAVVKCFAKWLTAVQSMWPYTSELRIKMTGRFSKPAELTVQIPTSTYVRLTTPNSSWPTSRIPYLDTAIAALLNLHLSRLTIAFYEDRVSPKDLNMPTAAPCGMIYELNILLCGDTVAKQVLLGPNYTQHPAQQISHASIRTKQLVINWATDRTSEQATKWRLDHFGHCSIMRDFLKKDPVKTFTSSTSGYLAFDFDVSGISSRAKPDAAASKKKRKKARLPRRLST